MKTKRLHFPGLTWRQNFFSYSDLDGQIPRYKGLKQMGAEVCLLIQAEKIFASKYPVEQKCP